MKKIRYFIILLLFSGSCQTKQLKDHVLDQYNPVWDSPSEFSSGSMPLGNGDIGVNAWVEESGDLLFYIGKTDAWSENGRLLKLGKIRVSFSPNLVAGDISFLQELQFRKGQWIVEMGNGNDRRKICMWVDANRPVVHVEIKGDKNFEALVHFEPWRTTRRAAREDEMHSFYSYMNYDGNIFIEPDKVLDLPEGQIVWYHHNERSVYKETMLLQGLDSLIEEEKDPLLHRTFGGLVRGKNLVKVDSMTLKSVRVSSRQNLSVYLLTTEKSTKEEWKKKIEEIAKNIEAVDSRLAKEEHYYWWDQFWNRSWVRVSGGDSEETGNISLGWHANRYLTACGGRGKFPIKFNGSIFNVDGESGTKTGSASGDPPNWDADYRQWGDPFWFQNQRQVYWPMIAAGDYDMMQPFFNMYFNLLPFAKKRTALYFGHEGAFFPETLLFYGPYANSNYGWEREGKEDWETDNNYIKRYWQGGLELSTMMLEYYHYSGDIEFLNELAMPIIHEIITFFSNHWPLDPEGKIEFYPAQALETLWDVKNPVPEIAGMKKVLSELLKLPENLTTGKQRTDWKKIMASIPDFPIEKDEKGKQYMPPAWENYSESHNIENIALYSVFPYRQYGVGYDNIEMMRNTYYNRDFATSYTCWSNDNVFAAYLGLPDKARIQLSERFVRSGGYRFPAFYIEGDWVPDHDNGGVAQQAIQAMLLQAVDEKLYLFPAWPNEWDVDFKLHAPGNTIVEARLKDGKLEKLIVSPEERRKDIVLLPKQ